MDNSATTAIRKKCLDCMSGSSKAVKWCPSDGIHGSKCPLWPFRFGIRPSTAMRTVGRQFMTPKDMPEANAPLDDLHG